MENGITVSFTGTPELVYWMTIAYDLYAHCRPFDRSTDLMTIENVNWVIDEIAGILPEIHDELLGNSDGESGLELGAKVLHDFEIERRKRNMRE